MICAFRNITFGTLLIKMRMHFDMIFLNLYPHKIFTQIFIVFFSDSFRFFGCHLLIFVNFMPLFMNLNILFYLVRIKEKYILSKDVLIQLNFKTDFKYFRMQVELEKHILIS